KVKLADGTSYGAELVIMSTGMRGNVAIAEAAGLAMGRLVEVGEDMSTSAEDVWACGDCVEFEGAPQAFWAQAVETGRVAGANAAGEEIAYRAIGSSLVINAMNTSIFALGTNGKEPGRKYRTVEMRDEQRGSYEKYYFFNNRLAGVILVGDTSKMPELTKAVEEGASYTSIFGKHN
ncbi:MAG: FAD-dependent oxidoreductase, partial [Oscillospiraceae bacterium]|nr:FAD-dependent oxidoreductase [Oscillospiraceae bacterium]